jgi:hypothetical protein
VAGQDDGVAAQGSVDDTGLTQSQQGSQDLVQSGVGETVGGGF